MGNILLATAGLLLGLGLYLFLYRFQVGAERTFRALSNALPWEKAFRQPTFTVYRKCPDIWSELTLVRTRPWKKIYAEYSIDLPLPGSATLRRALYDDLRAIDKKAREGIPGYDTEITKGKVSLRISVATTLGSAVDRAGTIVDLIYRLGDIIVKYGMDRSVKYVRSGGEDGVYFTKMEGNICTQSIELFDAFDVTVYTYDSFSSNTLDPEFESFVSGKEYEDTLSYSKRNKVDGRVDVVDMKMFMKKLRPGMKGKATAVTAVRSNDGAECFRTTLVPAHGKGEKTSFVLVHNGNGWWTYVISLTWPDEVNRFESGGEAADYLLRVIVEHVASLPGGEKQGD